MTDDEIIRLVGEHIMGWAWMNSADFHAPKTWYARGANLDSADFNPLTDDADACDVLDEMAELGYRVSLTLGNLFTPDKWTCLFTRKQVWERPDESHAETDRRRAICIAALKAVGAWEV